MSKVRGNNVVVYFFHDSIWKLYACALSASIKISTDLQETSEVGAGDFFTGRPGKHSFSATLTGFVNLQLPNTLALPDIRAIQIAHTKMLMRFQRTDDTANVYTDEAYFYIVDTSDEGGVGAMNSFSVELKGTGSFTTIFTPTPTNLSSTVHTFDYIATGGETTFSDASLVGKNIVGAWKSQSYRVILSGTPLGQETKYTSAAGSFDWPVELETGEFVHIEYQDM